MQLEASYGVLACLWVIGVPVVRVVCFGWNTGTNGGSCNQPPPSPSPTRECTLALTLTLTRECTPTGLVGLWSVMPALYGLLNIVLAALWLRRDFAVMSQDIIRENAEKGAAEAGGEASEGAGDKAAYAEVAALDEDGEGESSRDRAGVEMVAMAG